MQREREWREGEKVRERERISRERMEREHGEREQDIV